MSEGTIINEGIAGATGMNFIRCAYGEGMRRPSWEYSTVRVANPKEDLAEFLNRHGADGWELVDINDDLWCIFKRRASPLEAKQGQSGTSQPPDPKRPL
jgi:hypothetical protein